MQSWKRASDIRPEKKGLYLVTDNVSWNIFLISNGHVMKYDGWDDGYSVNKDFDEKDWWWMPLPNRPDGESPLWE